jgi:hypothetical protein
MTRREGGAATEGRRRAPRPRCDFIPSLGTESRGY